MNRSSLPVSPASQRGAKAKRSPVDHVADTGRQISGCHFRAKSLGHAYYICRYQSSRNAFVQVYIKPPAYFLLHWLRVFTLSSYTRFGPTAACMRCTSVISTLGSQSNVFRCSVPIACRGACHGSRWIVLVIQQLLALSSPWLTLSTTVFTTPTHRNQGSSGD